MGSEAGKHRRAVPVLKIGAVLAVCLQGDLDDSTVIEVEEDLTRTVAKERSRGVLLDLSGLDVVDSFVARVIARLAGMVRLLGAETVVVGIQPAVAITLVELGVPMGGLNTALNAEAGMALLARLIEMADGGGGAGPVARSPRP
jgi:rsbT antagonist protein RsbS